MAIIGIDLGTSNSAAAVLRGGRPVIIPSAEGISIGGKAFPSYVALTADGQVLVGEPARRQATSNPEGTASAFKRKMGSDFHFLIVSLTSFIAMLMAIFMIVAASQLRDARVVFLSLAFLGIAAAWNKAVPPLVVGTFVAIHVPSGCNVALTPFTQTV